MTAAPPGMLPSSLLWARPDAAAASSAATAAGAAAASASRAGRQAAATRLPRGCCCCLLTQAAVPATADDWREATSDTPGSSDCRRGTCLDGSAGASDALSVVCAATDRGGVPAGQPLAGIQLGRTTVYVMEPLFISARALGRQPTRCQKWFLQAKHGGLHMVAIHNQYHDTSKNALGSLQISSAGFSPNMGATIESRTGPVLLALLPTWIVIVVDARIQRAVGCKRYAAFCLHVSTRLCRKCSRRSNCTRPRCELKQSYIGLDIFPTLHKAGLSLSAGRVGADMQTTQRVQTPRSRLPALGRCTPRRLHFARPQHVAAQQRRAVLAHGAATDDTLTADVVIVGAGGCWCDVGCAGSSSTPRITLWPDVHKTSVQ